MTTGLKIEERSNQIAKKMGDKQDEFLAKIQYKREICELHKNQDPRKTRFRAKKTIRRGAVVIDHIPDSNAVEYSFVRHSCRPNLFADWDPIKKSGYFAALRVILPGEELSVNHLPLRLLYGPCEIRKKALAAVKNEPVCECERCAPFLNPDVKGAAKREDERWLNKLKRSKNRKFKTEEFDRLILRLRVLDNLTKSENVPIEHLLNYIREQPIVLKRAVALAEEIFEETHYKRVDLRNFQIREEYYAKYDRLQDNPDSVETKLSLMRLMRLLLRQIYCEQRFLPNCRTVSSIIYQKVRPACISICGEAWLKNISEYHKIQKLDQVSFDQTLDSQ